ncbi:MAG: ATP-binding protein [bacterium]
MISFTMIMLTLVLVMSVVSLWSVQRIGHDGEIILNASSYNCMIHNLRLSFEKLIMPPHDYLIYSNPNEIFKFESNLKEIDQILSNVTEMIKTHKDEWDDGRERYLTSASQGIINIESLAHEILYIPDPLGIKAGRLMIEMDEHSEHIRQALRELIHMGLKDKNSRIIQSLYEFMISFQGLLMPPHDYLIMGNKAERENYRILLAHLTSEMDQILKLSKTGPSKEIINTLKNNFEMVAGLASQILAIEDPLRYEGVEKMKKMDFIAEQVVTDLDTLMEYYKKDGKRAKEMADKMKTALMHFTILTSLLLVIGGMIGGILFSSNVTGPVRQLLKATMKVSAGDLNHKAQVDSSDEIGELADSFNRMTESLRIYQEQLIRAKEYINNIIKSMIDTLVVVNTDYTIRTVNQAALRLLKYDKEEDLVGQPVEKIFAKNGANIRGPKTEMLIREGFTNYDAFYRTSDNVEIPVNLSVSMMQDKAGNLLGMVYVARDMREIHNLINELSQAYKNIKSTQAQMIQSSKLASMGVLAEGVAHDIANPVNAIINYADLIKAELNPKSDPASYVQGILYEGERITNIVQNLLAFARVEKNGFSPCYIPDIINVSLAFMDAYLIMNKIKVQTCYDSNLPRIRAKYSQLEQVFINLILNARDALNEKYTQANGNKLIQIEVKKIKKKGIPYLRILFTDNGAGIGKDKIGNISDPFFTTKRDEKRTGLGLSVSYGVIADHKGSIEVRSLEGRQTTFVIDLPTEDGWMILEG